MNHDKPKTPLGGLPLVSHERSQADYRKQQLFAQLGQRGGPVTTPPVRSPAAKRSDPALSAEIQRERSRTVDRRPEIAPEAKAEAKPSLVERKKKPERSLADYRRVVLFDRLPGGERLERGISKAAPSFQELVDEALERHADNTLGLGAIRAMLELPGFSSLNSEDQRAAIAVIDGPVLGQEVDEQRRWFTKEVWKAIQQRVALGLGQVGALPAAKQTEVLRGFLTEPKEHITLLTAENGHAVVACGWKPGEQRSLMNYGRWPASSGTWAFVKSPDSIMRRAFEPARNTVYEFATYRVSMDDQRQLIEWLERAFGVNDLAVGPRSRAFPLARVFVKFTVSLMNILAKKRATRALVARGRSTGAQLMKERIQ